MDSMLDKYLEMTNIVMTKEERDEVEQAITEHLDGTDPGERKFAKVIRDCVAILNGGELFIVMPCKKPPPVLSWDNRREFLIPEAVAEMKHPLIFMSPQCGSLFSAITSPIPTDKECTSSK